MVKLKNKINKLNKKKLCTQKEVVCKQCTSHWYYVIGTSPRSAWSKLRFLSFCDQHPWKDVKSLVVFF